MFFNLFNKKVKRRIPAWKRWLTFRDDYIRKYKKKHKVLTCQNPYCGKTDLEESGDGPNVATIDHIIPVSTGIDKYDKSNFQILCAHCNSKKKDKTQEEFIKEQKDGYEKRTAGKKQQAQS